METVDLTEIESVILDYIYDKKGVRVNVDILKGIPRDPMLAHHPIIGQVASQKIVEAVEIYNLIILKNGKDE